MSEIEVLEGEYVQEIAYLIPDLETTCGICHAEFLDSEDLAIHVKQVHEGSAAYLNVCQFCDEAYTDLDDYACHIRDIHIFELQCCRCCTKCFIDMKLAKKHERKHRSNSGMYACSQCTGHFTTQMELEMHEVVNHENTLDGVILKCMNHLSALLKFKAVSFLQADEKVMICKSCNYTSVDSYSYFNHLKNSKCDVCVCDKCGNVYKLKKYLIKHFKLKSRCIDPQEYVSHLTKCPTCKNDVYGLQLQAHIKYCNVYKCDACNIRFESVDELSTHQSKAHPLDLEVLKCDYCPKEYVGQAALDKHIERSHRHMFILYKYACKECGAIFKHPQKLFAHYYTTHKALEPYTCKLCDKKFRKRKSFTIHIKLVHKGEGVVEFDEQYHVFYNDKKSENPFIPKCVIPELLPPENTSEPKKTENNKIIKRTKRLSKKNQDSEYECPSDTTMMENDTVTELEQDENYITDTDKRPKKAVKTKKKRKKRIGKLTEIVLTSDDDDSEPLIKIKKKVERKRFQKFFSPNAKQRMINRKQLTCKFCKKYCYTYQNYHNHIKIHKKNESIQCIKCSRSFMTKKELLEHVSTDHATSKLIETLKSVLERKQGDTHHISKSNNLTPSEKFMKTLVRVKVDKTCIPAKIQQINNSSVKKFIENFIPENEQKQSNDPGVTIRQYNSPFYRMHSIKLNKFVPDTPVETIKLKMPEKFKEESTERVRVHIKMVHQPPKQSLIKYDAVTSYNNDMSESFQDYEEYEDYKHDSIPEVAQEVMLEETDDSPGQVLSSHKIDLPKLPQWYPNLHIATLQPQAPFFKIIKIDRTNDEPVLINAQVEKVVQPPSVKDEIISLPDGTKFVTANPLAHLLGNKPVEEVMEPIKNKHYTPVHKNYSGLLANAMRNLETKKANKTNKKRVKKSDVQKD